MGEQARGQSYDLREEWEEVIKSFKGLNHNISYQHQSLHGVLNCTVKMMHSLKKSGIYQCPRHKQWTELIDWSQVKLVSNATTAISNSNDKNTTLCDCHQNVCHVPMVRLPHNEVRNLCTWRPTQVLKTVCTLHALDPLVVLFQSALAMYSFLNLMKSVVASLCRQPRSLYVVQKLRHFHRTHALVSVFQQSSDY